MSEDHSEIVAFEFSDQPAILVADPSQSADSLLVQRLAHEGYRVLLASNIKQVIQIATSQPVFYAVTELGFQDGTGRELIEFLATRHPYCRTVVHSARCDVPTAVWATRAGAVDVLPKPMGVDFVIGILLEKDPRSCASLLALEKPNHVRDEHIRQVYLSCGSNITRAAHRLSMHRRTLQRMLFRSPILGMLDK
jgi:two-component system response regulator RegA